MVLLCWPELMLVQFAADIFAECGKIASKMKSAPESVPPLLFRGGSSLEHELPPQHCYRMIAVTSSRTCSTCQRLERQRSRSRIEICHLDL